MRKETFILKLNWKSVITRLSDKQAGVLLKAIYEYVESGVTAGIDDEKVGMALEFIKLDIDTFSESYNRKVKANAENGKKGGAPKGNSNALKQPKTSQTTENKPNKPNKPNDNDNDNDNVFLEEEGKNPPTQTTSEKPTEKPIEPVGSEKVQIAAREAWEDKGWREAVCMGNNLSMENLTLWMAKYNASLMNDVIHDFSTRTYKKMFGGWLSGQMAKGYKLPPKENEPQRTHTIKTI